METITTSAIETIAAAVSDASWGSLGGGTMVFGRDGSGGAWYSRESRPSVGVGEVTIAVPSRSISKAEAVALVRDILSDEGVCDA